MNQIRENYIKEVTHDLSKSNQKKLKYTRPLQQKRIRIEYDFFGTKHVHDFVSITEDRCFVWLQERAQLRYVNFSSIRRIFVNGRSSFMSVNDLYSCNRYTIYNSSNKKANASLSLSYTPSRLNYDESATSDEGIPLANALKAIYSPSQSSKTGSEGSNDHNYSNASDRELINKLIEMNNAQRSQVSVLVELLQRERKGETIPPPASVAVPSPEIEEIKSHFATFETKFNEIITSIKTLDNKINKVFQGQNEIKKQIQSLTQMDKRLNNSSNNNYHAMSHDTADIPAPIQVIINPTDLQNNNKIKQIQIDKNMLEQEENNNTNNNKLSLKYNFCKKPLSVIVDQLENFKHDVRSSFIARAESIGIPTDSDQYIINKALNNKLNIVINMVANRFGKQAPNFNKIWSNFVIKEINK